MFLACQGTVTVARGRYLKNDMGKSGKDKPNHHKYVNPQETLIEIREYSMSNPSHFIKQPIWVRKQI